MKYTFTLLIALLLAPLISLHAAEPNVFDIMAHGAKGDGTTMNTQAIQQAVDACHDAGGGVVSVPKGVFLTGSLRLKSGVVLRVEKDAILRGSPKIADYAVETAELDWIDAQDRLNMFKSTNTQFRPALIYAEDAERIGLEGSGVIDGQGGAEAKVFPNKDDAQRRIPMLIRFERCRDLKLSGLTLINPAMFATFFARCTNIQIERVTVRALGGFRLSGVAGLAARVDRVEIDAVFAVVDPAYAAQPSRINAEGAGKVAWVFRVGGRAEIAWSEVTRVKPYKDRFGVEIGDVKALDF